MNRLGFDTRKGATLRQVTSICKTCKVVIKDRRSHKRVYCSISCRNNNPEYRVMLRGAGKKSAQRDTTGSNNPNWRGGNTAERHTMMSRQVYKDWRKAVYERDGYACVKCGTAGTGKNLNADHIKPYRTHPELRLEVSNGRTLCVDCHKQTDTYGWKFFNKLRKDGVWQPSA